MKKTYIAPTLLAVKVSPLMAQLSGGSPGVEGAWASSNAYEGPTGFLWDDNTGTEEE